MNLKQTRLALGLSLRDAAALVGVSHQQIKKAESGMVGKVAVEQIRAAYRKHARSNTKLIISEGNHAVLKSTKKSKEPQSVTITFYQDADGLPLLAYEAESHQLGAAVVEAIAAYTGHTATRVKK